MEANAQPMANLFIHSDGKVLRLNMSCVAARGLKLLLNIDVDKPTGKEKSSKGMTGVQGGRKQERRQEDQRRSLENEKKRKEKDTHTYTHTPRPPSISRL